MKEGKINIKKRRYNKWTQNKLKEKFGEYEATKYLESLGYEILCNNFRCLQGEIDIIAKDREEIVFVEVKTRYNKHYGEARDAVDKNKQKHILNCAKYYLYKNRKENAFVRIDVIEVYPKNDSFLIKHIKQAI